MMKPDSLYNHGLRPLKYSEKGARIYQLFQMHKNSPDVDKTMAEDQNKYWGWNRCGDNVC